MRPFRSEFHESHDEVKFTTKTRSHDEKNLKIGWMTCIITNYKNSQWYEVSSTTTAHILLLPVIH